MKKHIALLAMLGCGFAAVSLSPVCAQDEETDTDAPAKTEQAEKKAPKKNAKKAASAVVTAVKKCKKLGGNLNANADVYIYLSSASWCGPCQQEMPAIVEAHKAMKKAGTCDIILVGADHSPDGVKNYLKSHKAKFAAVWGDDKKAAELPGYTKPMGIPNAIFVTRDGKVIKSGHGSLIEQWESVVESAAEKKTDDAAE